MKEVIERAYEYCKNCSPIFDDGIEQYPLICNNCYLWGAPSCPYNQKEIMKKEGIDYD